jgi:hypothetical protein
LEYFDLVAGLADSVFLVGELGKENAASAPPAYFAFVRISI